MLTRRLTWDSNNGRLSKCITTAAGSLNFPDLCNSCPDTRIDIRDRSPSSHTAAPAATSSEYMPGNSRSNSWAPRLHRA